jgi:Flp pilus assembly pilin Flp
MSALTEFYLRSRERLLRKTKGQTMAEYALILGAVAIVVYVTYELLGQDIPVLVTNIDSYLTAT